MVNRICHTDIRMLGFNSDERKQKYTEVKTMEEHRPSKRASSKCYATFLDNLYKLANFLGETEQWYEKQVKILTKQATVARRELHFVELEMNKLEKKSKLSKAEEKKLGRLMERADDLVDIDIFSPREARTFRKFREFIRILGLSYLITIFEGYLVDIVREILLAYPSKLESGTQLSAETVLKMRGQKQIIRHLVEHEIDDFSHKSFPKVVKYFRRKFSINLNASSVSIDQMKEIFETRHIHVHNRGKVSRQYLRSIRDSKLKLGHYKSVTRNYLRNSINLIINTVQFIDTEVQIKYFTESIPKKT